MTARSCGWLWCVCAWAAAVAACDDPFDNVLCVYTLSPADEAAFSATDGQVSAFWQAWDSRDIVDLIAPDNCYPGRCGFSGPDDASLVIKAAGTERGLYLLATVGDNIWVDPADDNDWGADAMDLYVDAQDCLIGLYNSTLSYTTQQVFVWMGGAAAPSGCRIAYYDENMWSWQGTPMSWSDMGAVWGLQAEVVQVDATHKAQEWFFPWDRFGKGLGVGTPLAGRRVALSGGYNDKDGDNTDPHCLRWLGRDPWAEDAKTVNYWGDLLLADDMGSVVSTTGARPGQARAAARRVAPNASGRAFNNLKGERIPSGRGMAPAVVVTGGARVCAMSSVR
jgi:hypothetical protein